MTTIKLISVWTGPAPLPPWYDQFKQRIEANKPFIDWQLVTFADHVDFNHYVTKALGTPCNKNSGYALCDVRPLFGDIFADLFNGYEWWGWCDLDIVAGNLERTLAPLLPHHDIISTESYAINGAMTLLRNIPATRTLYRNTDYAKMLANQNYCNFDECGFNSKTMMLTGTINDNQHFTNIAHDSNLRIHYDDRSCNELEHVISGDLPARCCELRNGNLLEIPSGRELTLYHFATTWPLPNRYRDKLAEQRDYWASYRPPTDAPAESPAFWTARVARVIATKLPIHVLAFDTSQANWGAIQRHTRRMLAKMLANKRVKLLDAGCSYGPLLEALAGIAVDYTGVDYCNAMLDVARNRHSDQKFCYGDMRNLPFADKEFDICVCRGIEGSTRALLSNDAWNSMETELRRVAHTVVLIDHSQNIKVLNENDP